MHRDTIGVMHYKKRKSGQTYSACFEMERQLNMGEKVGILDIRANEDDSYLKRVVKILEDSFCVKVDVTPVFKMVPRNNSKVIYDEWGESVGIEILPQKKVKIGWTLVKSK